MLITPVTRSGIVDCACCGQHIMTSDMAKPAYCGGCSPDGECDSAESWHCATGECDGTGCDENGQH